MARRSDDYRATEGFLMDDLFNATGIGATVYADRHLVVMRTEEPYGLRFAGEIDVSNSSAVASSIRAIFPGSGRPHLDFSGLSFCDVSGIRALIETARELGAGRGLLLHGLPAQVHAVLRVTGWWDVPNLALCRCGGGR